MHKTRRKHLKVGVKVTKACIATLVVILAFASISYADGKLPAEKFFPQIGKKDHKGIYCGLPKRHLIKLYPISSELQRFVPNELITDLIDNDLHNYEVVAIGLTHDGRWYGRLYDPTGKKTYAYGRRVTPGEKSRFGNLVDNYYATLK